jgi:hypothetical protein
MLERLFPGDARPDSSEGVQQGFALASLSFCAGIHPELVALDAELAAFDGFARAIMDDVYACGPAWIVFPAVQRFCQSLRLLTGLESHVGKFSCFSHAHELDGCPFRAAAGVPVGHRIGDNGALARGLMVGGVPIGTEAYCRAELLDIADGVVRYIESTVEQLAEQRHALWASLYYCCQTRFDYWLRHCPPHQTEVAASRIDDALIAAATSLTYDGCLDDEITLERFALPARLRGCGIRRRVTLALSAYCACLAEVMPRLIDRATVQGGPRTLRGFFPALEEAFGRGSFDPGGQWLTAFIDGASPAALDFEYYWEELRQDAHQLVDTHRSPLGFPARLAGQSYPEHLQRRITEEYESARRALLHARIQQLPRSDTRRVAWESVDRLSSQWVPSWPTRELEMSAAETAEVITTYLGRESPAVRHLAGRPIACGSRAHRVAPRTCDPFGIQLGLATLPGTSHTDCHDDCGRELFDLVREARFSIQLQPRYIVHGLIPPAILLRPGRPPSIVPDASITVSLPAVVTARRRRRGAFLARRCLQFDLKTIHAGTAHYASAQAAEEQSGAVRHRESAVAPSYIAHARELDVRYSPPGTTPIEDRIRSYTAVRGLIFGAFGEASADVHDLIAASATSIAQDQWRLQGARTAAEMRAFIISRARRRVGLAAVVAMARHRLERVPYIGLDRAALQAIMRRPRRDGDQRAAAPDPYFFAYQAGGREFGARAG